MNQGLIDTHCHLDLIVNFGQEILTSITKAKEAGISGIVQIGINEERSTAARNIVEEYSHLLPLRYTIGCHPSDDIDEEEKNQIISLISEYNRDKNCIGIGEIGLDYYHKNNFTQQQEMFRGFLELAEKVSLPVIIHSRDAAEDTLTILKEYTGRVRGIIHCYTYDLEYAKKFVELGYYISFSGIVVFKNAREIQATAASIPLDSILMETDAPYLAPPPYRGKRNEPSYVSYVLDKIIELRTEDPSVIKEQIYQNSRKFFNKEIV
ncbi:MAG: TatD family hydrolase [Leptospiraceae bacterium]|nr:TatD family hydrolase [Leptospiraceae bacterium]MCP5498788.1 TatD family hydrolase [Leptospiraceae bacterium]